MPHLRETRSKAAWFRHSGLATVKNYAASSGLGGRCSRMVAVISTPPSRLGASPQPPVSPHTLRAKQASTLVAHFEHHAAFGVRRVGQVAELSHPHEVGDVVMGRHERQRPVLVI